MYLVSALFFGFIGWQALSLVCGIRSAQKGERRVQEWAKLVERRTGKPPAWWQLNNARLYPWNLPRPPWYERTH